ncbi:substrate-binding domain-containing protein [Vallitalea okinawensis]|uniref:substrate-binding domain-containing protein n=1 Tax=Vallitalea okinawensis TaxID=2078660 RepID=UPI000CFBF3E6|nr:substrate-binding domain-containing protein [Vallitalea okinawensis]
MGQLRKIFIAFYVVSLLPVLILTGLELLLPNVPFLVYIGVVIFAVIMPFIFSKGMGDKKDGFLSKFVEKLNNWDFMDEVMDDQGHEEQGGLFGFYKEIRDYFKKLFTSINDMTVVSESLISSIDSVSDNAASISEISDGIAKGAISQAGEVETCAQLSEELSKKSEEMNEMSINLINETTKLNDICTIGNGNIQELKTNNEELYEVIEGIIQQVNNLVDLASNITKITEIMYGISDQTSLLALNASIEAARAGEVGRSFAVVAEEIRKLSQDSRESSANINDLITNIATSLTEIKGTLDQSEAIFSKQNTSVNQAADSFDNISNFTGMFIQQQNQFGENFNLFYKSQDVLASSIETIASVTQESAATTEELASLVMSQHNSIDALKDLTNNLQLNIDKIEENSRDIKVARAASNKKKFAIILDSTNEFWDPLKTTAHSTAKVYNVEVDIFEAGDRQHCVANQVNFLKNVLAEEYDGVAISPVDNPKIKELLNQISNSGTKLIFINSQLDGINSLGLYETNGINAGKAAAEVVTKMLGKKGTVVMGKWNDVHIECIEQRGQGFADGVKGYPNIQLETVSIPANPTEAEADSIIEGILRKHPDLELFYSTNIDWAIHYCRYKEKYGANYKIVTIDFIKSLRDEVKSGLIDSCISQRPFVWGEKSIKALSDAINGKSVDKYMDTGTFEINASNIDVFIKRFK